MKFIITESQIEKLVVRYLNGLKWKLIKKSEKGYGHITKNIYFLVQEGSENFADIRYDRWDGKCYINSDFIEKIGDLFSIDPDGYDDDVTIIITEWLETKLKIQIDIWNVQEVGGFIGDSLLSLEEN